MANRIKKMRYELVDNLKKLGTPGNWDHIINQIGMFSYTGLTDQQVKYMKSKNVFLMSSGRISMAGLTLKNVAYVAKTMDEAVRAHPRTKKFYLEFAKHKLSQAEYNVIKTPVIVDGVIMKEDGEMEQDDVQSVESFIKIKLVGSLSSTSTPELELSEHSKSSEANLQHVEAEEAENDEVQFTEHGSQVLSTSVQPGTYRASVTTFKTRSIQTLEPDMVKDLYQLKSIPARFEGTMLTPVYFDGLMLTPDRLDNLLTYAAKKGDNAIPVKFHGGMLTAAFKTLAENLNLGFGAEPVNVKFHGKLTGLTNNVGDEGIPVAFDGSMVPQAKSTKVKK